MAKPKGSPAAPLHREPVRKKTRQGDGQGSRPNHGRKPSRGQGR
jgi:hypothetical protein